MSSALLEAPLTAAMPKLTPIRTVLSTGEHRLHLHNLDRIVLTGFMGSGKSSVGKLLAEQLGWEFLDLDQEIESRDGRSVPQIFAQSGEPGFRKLEASALASLLGRHHMVLALGGGAPEALGNRLLLEQTPHTAVVYLQAPLPTLVARCSAQAADPAATARPLLSADPTELSARFTTRHPLYHRIATHHVDTESLALEDVTAALLNLLRP